MARKPTDEVQLKLRFQEGLRQRLEYLAARNGRSMNAEIVHALKQHVLLEEEPSGDREEREAQRSIQAQILQQLKIMNAKMGGAVSAIGTAGRKEGKS
jgi:plasmid stability protein